MNRSGKLIRKFTRSRLDLPPTSVKILRTAVQPSREFLLKHQRRSRPEVLSSAYLCFTESMADPPSRQGFIMEPFLENYCNPGNSTSNPPPLTIPPANLIMKNKEENVPLEADSYEEMMELKQRYLSDMKRYKSMRMWKRCRRDKPVSSTEESFALRLLSFNILAQHLLEMYPYLYKEHDKRALRWKNRRPLILQEIDEAEAHVVCLQEMQEEHLEEFLDHFQKSGYDYLYKKRTSDKKDGLLFLYRSDQLELLEYSKVELYQSGIELLSRDNVGIVAKLRVKSNPEIQIVISTTHLLYNPKRNDVRLGQTQLLLAEIERIAFIENTSDGTAKYAPIILAGDFNLEPDTGVYQFLTCGSFEYHGKGKNLEPTEYRRLSNSLIPPRLCVTDNCQHFHVLKKRIRGEGNGRVMLENTEICSSIDNNTTIKESGNNNNENSNVPSSSYGEINVDSTEPQTIEISEKLHAKFSSGTLTHPFDLRSVYHHTLSKSKQEATTHQGEWITVDYIFYSDLEPLEVYTLPTTSECNDLPCIPNFAVGSDHLCLGATFRVFKTKC